MGQDTEQDGKYPHAGACGAAVTMGAKHFNKNVDVSFQCLFISNTKSLYS